ncbi:Deoxyribose-phosphate aldolase [bioreactor metagenome]|uniref:deoxyribose-phosphate aldolase n=1 Tax=bioreactor metagenome TaxID=1076179 RepID=A0A645G8H7_9ZZZZ
MCIPPSFIRQAAEYVTGRLTLCTVIGFPNGYSTTAVKAFETQDALEAGADEIDMVINLGWAREGRWDLVREEIRTLKKVCGSRVLKVIVETCLLTREEKIEACRAVSDAGADFIKTSTGFSSGGATREDVALLRANVAPGVRLKASGGIRTLEDARDFIALGADRLGASALVGLVRGLTPGEAGNGYG